MRYWIIVGALLMAFSVVAGAMGSHYFVDSFGSETIKERFFRAHFYLIIHSIGIILFSLMGLKSGPYQKWQHLVPAFFLTGIFLFSGTLFADSLDIFHFNQLAPIGGSLFVTAWILFGFFAYKNYEGV